MRTIHSLIMFAFFFVNQVSAGDLLCKDTSTERTGSLIRTCSISDSENEGEARDRALESAYIELDKNCSKSIDCNNYEVTFHTFLNECEKNTIGIYKCYRGVEMKVLTSKRDTKIPRVFKDSTEILINLKNKIVQEEMVDLKRAIVELESIPEGASVFVDEVETCKTPCSRELQYGKHIIRFQKNDYEKFIKTIEVKSKVLKTISVELLESFGHLDITDAPKDAQVKIDGVLLAETKFKLRPGKHTVTINHSEYQSFHKEIEIKKGITERLVFIAEPLHGWLEISVSDEEGNALAASVSIDGKKYEEKTPTKLAVKIGERILVASSGSIVGSEKVIIRVNQNTKIHIKLKVHEKIQEFRLSISKLNFQFTNEKVFNQKKFNLELVQYLKIISELSIQVVALSKLTSSRDILEFYDLSSTPYKLLAKAIREYTPQGVDEAYLAAFKAGMMPIADALTEKALNLSNKKEIIENNLKK